MPDSDLGGQPANQASLLQALASLNEIGAAINRMPPEHANLAGALQRIVESAIRVVPASSAVIYAYDSRRRQFDTQQYVWAGESVPPAPGHEPRPDGLGQRAVTQRRVVLSYDESDLAIHPLKRSAGVRSAACFPMIVAEDVVGALYVYLPEARPFSDLERLMLENFVNQAALAVSHTRHLEAVQAELGRREEELGHLRRTGQLISSRLQINATLDAILQMALEITNARYGIFRLVDKTGRYLITRAIAGDGLAQPLVENLPVDANSVMAQAARTRQPLLIADLRQPPWSSIYYPLDARMEMRSELAVPLINVDGRLEGVLNLESTRVGAFSEQDSHLLQAMATQAVIAIQETRLLDALLEVAELLLTQPLQAVLERLTAFACDLLNASAGAIWKLDDGDPPALALQASTPAQTPGRRVAPAGSLAGRALLEQRTLYADRAGLDDPGALPEDWSPGWQNMLVVPLLSSGDQQALGAFSV
ncbi:MAG: GAF domain-containing protein, partial [Chloroflexota bacterium]